MFTNAAASAAPTVTAPSEHRSTPSAAPGTARTERRWELDALRGFMLVAMLSTHLPTRYSLAFGQPFGFVSAAEGFVMLSAYMAGMVYTQRSMRDGVPAMRKAFWRRALVVYGCQAASLIFLFTVIAALGGAFDHEEVRNLMSFYLREPLTGLWASLLLIYNPPLLDILPIYVIFMLISPWVLAHGLQHGWIGLLAVSAALWAASQFGLSEVLYGHLVHATGLSVPYRETGSFETFGWQLLWVLGLWMGARHAQTPALNRAPFPGWLIAAAAVYAAVFFVWRHVMGQQPFPHGNPVNFIFDKWNLGPMRVLNFLALMVLAMRYTEWLKQHLPRMRWLETMGRASLPVFCGHLVIVLIVLTIFGAGTPPRPWWLDTSLLLGSVVALVWLAKAVEAVENRGSRKTA